MVRIECRLDPSRLIRFTTCPSRRPPLINELDMRTDDLTSATGRTATSNINAYMCVCACLYVKEDMPKVLGQFV